MNKVLIKEFAPLVGSENILLEYADRVTCSYDAAVLESVVPSLVVRPVTCEALGNVIRLCNENRLPVTIRGAGTNLSGGTIPAQNAVVVLTHALNRILDINADDMYAVVEPGVITAKLAAAAEKKGLFYPPGPRQPGRINYRGQCSGKRGRTQGAQIRSDPGLCDAT